MTPPMTDIDRLTRAGRLLYGDWWHTRMAVELGVGRRSVQRWATGQLPVPPAMWPRIAELLRQHSRDAAAFARGLPKAA